MADPWRFAFSSTPALPPLAWLARIRYPAVDVAHGVSVRTSERGFFEGTWVGPPGIESVVESTTPFGSGIVADADRLTIVPPAHNLEGVYACRRDDELLVSNSLVATLAAAGLELVAGVDYPTLMRGISDGLSKVPIVVPTSGENVELYFFENLEVAADGTLRIRPKPRERPFGSYHDYVSRMRAALVSALSNAPGYDAVIALSAGYDSTAVAVLAAEAGCRCALTFPGGREWGGVTDEGDSGERTARRLGMEVELFDRMAYLNRDDLPEAEFVASGMSGEDVVSIAFERALGRTVHINGMVGGALWRKRRVRRTDLWRADLSGASVTEFRLRTDFLHLPLPVFGITELPSVHDIANSDEMRDFSVGGTYDEPIPRRIAEEGDIKRGTFATKKRAGTSVIHLEGISLLSPVTRDAVARWAAELGERLELRPRKPLGRRHRAAIRVAHALRLPGLVHDLEEYRRTLMHFEPEPGSLLFRWAVEVLGPRYAVLAPERPRE